MTLGWVITGTIGQFLLAYMLFLLSVFGFSAVCNTHPTRRVDVSVLNSALYVTPASCVLSAVVVMVLYRAGSGAMAYLWYAAPLFVFSGYWVYTMLFIRSR